MKKLLALSLVTLLCCVSFFGCASSTPNENTGGGSTGGSVQNSTGGASNVVSDEYWNSLTSEELYEMALEEGGEINIYTISSRMSRTVETFMEAYPGLTAVASNYKQNEAVSKIQIEADSGNPNADILQAKDDNGEIYYDFYPLGYLETYYPTDIIQHIDDELLEYGMPFYAGLSFWYYNTAVYPDGPPVSNWWEVVELDENGDNVYQLFFKNPGGNSTELSFYCNMVLQSDMLEQAYVDHYGEPLTYTYDASMLPNVPENNAGYELLYRLSQSKFTLISDGDDIVEAVHNSTGPALGFSSAGKITNRDDNGWNIGWTTHMAPYTNKMNTNYIYLVKDTDNPAGARLFIRYLMGEADGQGEGFEPFTKEGNWSIRDDYTNPNNPFAIDEIPTLAGDITGVYEIYLDVDDFWNYWINLNPNL